MPSQESARSCICVLAESMLPLSMISLLDFETIPTVWYVLFSILFICIHAQFLNQEQPPQL